MTESKKEAKESTATKFVKQIKATTGAWWKSKVETSSEAPPEVQPSSDQPTPEQKKKPSGRRPRSAPKARVNQKQSAAPGETGTTEPPVSEGPTASGQQAADGDGSTPTKDGRQSRRPRGKRGGRKKPAVQKSDSQAEPTTDEQPPADQKKPQPRGGRKPGRRAETSADSEGADQTAEQVDGSKPVVKLLINADEPEECRLALLEDGRLESLHVTSVSRVHTRNNIYKARVVAIEPNLQAAFIDYGVEKNGFLAFSEIHPEYYRQGLSPEIQAHVDNNHWKKLSISDVLEKGQEMLVQVVKEEIGKKGANMTTYLSIPGRCVVLMPGSDSEGVSRKISGEERRNKLREIVNSLPIPEGIGWIVRTASVDITKSALTKDVRFLLKLWKEIKAKGQHLEGVGLLYQDHNCVMRFLREYFDPSTQEILVDDEASLEKVREFTEMLPAKQRNVKVKLHRGARPIFNHYSVEDQIESIYQPNVNLPSGGSIVIEPTEALVSIDVNSGSTAKNKNFEETIFQANMEAAAELARQLRLRDLGGLIVVDFIDMRNSRNVREVEKQVKTSMKRDKAKVDISRISRFGLMQISRQKLGSPIESGNYRLCEHCRGRGTVRSVETMALFYLRRIQTGASRKQVINIDCRFPLDVAQYLLNNKRQELLDLEEKYETGITVISDPTLKPAEHDITFGKAEKEDGPKKQA